MNKSASNTLSVAHFKEKKKQHKTPKTKPTNKKTPRAGFLRFPGGGVITHTQEHLQTPVFFGAS